MVVYVALIIGVAIAMPPLLMGIINRVKSLCSGRRGAPLLQLVYDNIRLLRKSSVYSVTVTPIFRVAPWVSLVTAIASGAVAPLIGVRSLVSFPFDFVWFAYVWGLGRVGTMLAALDTGSSFEGMGAAREATFSTLLEPALFVVMGALCLTSGKSTLMGALLSQPKLANGNLVTWACSVVTLFIILQVETTRMPVDDPTTHLELTMIHEVMVLDHSGPDLAAIQAASSLKFFVGVSVLATLLNPYAGSVSYLAVILHFGLCVLVTVVIAMVEALVARLKLSAVPKYIATALAFAAIALIATTWRSGTIR